MCRHVAHLGAPRPITELLHASHGLCAQGRAPREMIVADDNPDGWGIAWWTSPQVAPRHYRSTEPIWTDTGFHHATDRASAMLAAARKASPGTTLRTVNNAPFVAATALGPVAFSLNGHVFQRGSVARLRAEVPPGVSLAGDTDSEVLFAILRAHIAEGHDLAAALAAVHAVVAPTPDVYVNLMAMTANALVATTWRHTLYAHHSDRGTTLASEPLDPDPAWSRVPDAHLVSVDAQGCHLTPLDGRP